MTELEDYDISVIEGGSPRFEPTYQFTYDPGSQHPLAYYKTIIRVHDFEPHVDRFVDAVTLNKRPKFYFNDRNGFPIFLPIYSIRGYYLDEDELLPVLDLVVSVS